MVCKHQWKDATFWFLPLTYCTECKTVYLKAGHARIQQSIRATNPNATDNEVSKKVKAYVDSLIKRFKETL